MKKLTKTILALGAVLALAGCNSKCTYAEFHEAAMNVGNHGYNSAEVKAADKTYTLSYSTTLKIFASTDVAAAGYVTLVNTYQAKVVGEVEGATYAKGSGFSYSYEAKDSEGKVTSSENSEWNDKGFLVSYNLTSGDSSLKFTVSYK